MQYRSGTVSVEHDSNIVTFSGNTADASQVDIGDQFKLDLNGDPIYQVASRTPISGPVVESLTLSTPYGGADTAGAAYQIVSDFSVSRGYPLLAQGDLDSADWLSRIVTMIDSDLGSLLGQIVGAVPSLTDGKLIYKSDNGLADSPIYFDDALTRIGIGTTSPDGLALVTIKGGTQAVGGYQLSLEELASGGYGTGIAFRHIDSSDLSKHTAAKIVVDGTASWDSEASRTSHMSFWALNAGIPIEVARMTATGALTVGVPNSVLVSLVGNGSIGIANDASMKAALADGSGWASLIGLGINNSVIIDRDGHGVRFGEALRPCGNGGIATNGAVSGDGGNGPVSTEQYAWRRYVSDDGGNEWVQVWK